MKTLIVGAGATGGYIGVLLADVMKERGLRSSCAAGGRHGCWLTGSRRPSPGPVSYTHLTLPTKA